MLKLEGDTLRQLRGEKGCFTKGGRGVCVFVYIEIKNQCVRKEV